MLEFDYFIIPQFNYKVVFQFSTYSCGSIINGHRVEYWRMVAFSVDILSMGRPSLFQAAIWASSEKRAKVSTPSVCGMWGCG